MPYFSNICCRHLTSENGLTLTHSIYRCFDYSAVQPHSSSCEPASECNLRSNLRPHNCNPTKLHSKYRAVVPLSSRTCHCHTRNGQIGYHPSTCRSCSNCVFFRQGQVGALRYLYGRCGHIHYHFCVYQQHE